MLLHLRLFGVQGGAGAFTGFGRIHHFLFEIVDVLQRRPLIDVIPAAGCAAPRLRLFIDAARELGAVSLPPPRAVVVIERLRLTLLFFALLPLP